jgi:hypothetical protein
MNGQRQSVSEVLCSAIASTLKSSGRAVPEFKGTDRPLEDYEGLDSQCGLEVTVVLEESLGVEDLGTNIFVNGNGKTSEACSIDEIISTILERMKTPKGKAS